MSCQVLYNHLQKLWDQKAYWLWPFIPLSWIFTLCASLRRTLYQRDILKRTKFKIPVIVIGNLNLGGSGKTPLVIYIAKMFEKRGLKVGIISRGYKGSHQRPTFVETSSDAALVGDEPLMMAQHMGCPIVVGKNRVAALRSLLERQAVDVVLSDDGLQHYALERSIEIAVISPEQKLANANSYCLPAGPLREPLSRLKTVDLVVENASPVIARAVGPRQSSQNNKAFSMYYQPDLLYKAQDPTQAQALEAFKGMKVHAVAGLGNPKPFFSMLEAAGLTIIPHAYPDHHLYEAKDILFGDNLPVILTEKDFVKCRSFVNDAHWILPIHAVLSEGFDQALWTLYKGDHHG